METPSVTFPKPQKRVKHKYGAHKTIIPGVGEFPSKLEAAMYAHLQLLERAGELRDLQRYASVKLTDANIAYKPDARAFHTALGETVYFEAKGHETDTWRIKRRLWLAYGPGRLYVYKGTARKVYEHEVLIPRGGK